MRLLPLPTYINYASNEYKTLKNLAEFKINDIQDCYLIIPFFRTLESKERERKKNLVGNK